jgi:hypothetical protein
LRYYKLTAHSFLKFGNNKPTKINAMVNYRKFNEKGKHKFFEIKYNQAYSPLVEYLGSVEIILPNDSSLLSKFKIDLGAYRVGPLSGTRIIMSFDILKYIILK